MNSQHDEKWLATAKHLHQYPEGYRGGPGAGYIAVTLLGVATDAQNASFFIRAEHRNSPSLPTCCPSGP
jgi:hypothetical protein